MAEQIETHDALLEYISATSPPVTTVNKRIRHPGVAPGLPRFAGDCLCLTTATRSHPSMETRPRLRRNGSSDESYRDFKISRWSPQGSPGRHSQRSGCSIRSVVVNTSEGRAPPKSRPRRMRGEGLERINSAGSLGVPASPLALLDSTVAALDSRGTSVGLAQGWLCLSFSQNSKSNGSDVDG